MIVTGWVLYALMFKPTGYGKRMGLQAVNVPAGQSQLAEPTFVAGAWVFGAFAFLCWSRGK